MQATPCWTTHFWEVSQDHDFLCSCWVSIINGPAAHPCQPSPQPQLHP